MRLPNTTERKDQENLLPLVNVVFLLLIFFMVAGAFSTPEPFNISPVVAVTDENAEIHTLTVVMSANGELAIDNEIIDPQQVIDIIQNRLQTNSLLKLQLKSDANADALHVVKLLEKLSLTDLESLSLLTTNH